MFVFFFSLLRVLFSVSFRVQRVGNCLFVFDLLTAQEVVAFLCLRWVAKFRLRTCVRRKWNAILCHLHVTSCDGVPINEGRSGKGPPRFYAD